MQKRILIWLFLFPVIVSLYIGTVHLPVSIWLGSGTLYWSIDNLKISLLASVLVIIVTALPTLLLEPLDLLLEKMEVFLRPLWMAIVCAICSYPIAKHFLPINSAAWWLPAIYCSMGAIPGFVCSWLSGKRAVVVSKGL